MITNLRLIADGDLASIVRDAVSGGVDLVQLREKNLPGAELLKLAREIKHAIKGRALLIVNERLDIAMASGADGVHLGEDGLLFVRPASLSLDLVEDLHGRAVGHSSLPASSTVVPFGPCFSSEAQERPRGAPRDPSKVEGRVHKSKPECDLRLKAG